MNTFTISCKHVFAVLLPPSRQSCMQSYAHYLDLLDNGCDEKLIVASLQLCPNALITGKHCQQCLQVSVMDAFSLAATLQWHGEDDRLSTPAKTFAADHSDMYLQVAGKLLNVATCTQAGCVCPEVRSRRHQQCSNFCMLALHDSASLLSVRQL